VARKVEAHQPPACEVRRFDSGNQVAPPDVISFVRARLTRPGVRHDSVTHMTHTHTHTQHARTHVYRERERERERERRVREIYVSERET